MTGCEQVRTILKQRLEKAGIPAADAWTRKKLPQGFQKAEFLLQHGFLDAIVPRREQRQAISNLLRLHSGGAENG